MVGSRTEAENTQNEPRAPNSARELINCQDTHSNGGMPGNTRATRKRFPTAKTGTV